MTKYKILGCNDEQTECDCCNRKGLKRTVILERYEHDDAVEIIRVGVDCAEILLRRNGSRKSAHQIKSDAIAIEEKKRAHEKYLADRLQWKINNRIQSTALLANQIYIKNWPAFDVNGPTNNHGELLSNGVQYVRIPTGKDYKAIESDFIDYLIINNFKSYKPL